MRTLTRSLVLASALGFVAAPALACQDTVMHNQQQAQMMLDQYPEGATHEQVTTYGEQVFVRYDTDGDGYLSDEEVIVRNKAAVEAEGNVVIFDDHAIKPVDVDGDGRISYDEWNAEVGSYFGSLDLNNNGIVDGAEAGAAYGQ